MKNQTPTDTHSENACHFCGAHANKRRIPRRLLIGLGLALVIGVWLFREPLRERIRESATLANDAPTPEVVADMIEQAADPRVALLAAWNSGKIVHREVAIRSLSQIIPKSQPLSSEFESILLAAALDPDMNVRESALGTLRERHHPALTALAAEQLGDPDQHVRLLGLQHLKAAASSVGVPFVAALLDDPDIAVLGMSLKLLQNWSGQQFGAKLVDTVQVESKSTGLREFQSEGIAIRSFSHFGLPGRHSTRKPTCGRRPRWRWTARCNSASRVRKTNATRSKSPRTSRLGRRYPRLPPRTVSLRSSSNRPRGNDSSIAHGGSHDGAGFQFPGVVRWRMPAARTDERHFVGAASP